MYVGRAVLVGRDNKNKPFLIYILASRSFKNREIVKYGNAAYVVCKNNIESPYLTYCCFRCNEDIAVAGNGSHVEIIFDNLLENENVVNVIANTLATFGYEKDHLKTPRIVGVVFKNKLYFGVVRHDLVFAKKFDPESGEAFLLSTYGFKEKIEENVVYFDVSDVREGINKLGLEEIISYLVFCGGRIEIY